MMVVEKTYRGTKLLCAMEKWNLKNIKLSIFDVLKKRLYFIYKMSIEF